MIPREKILEAYEILHGRKLKDESYIDVLSHEKDIDALRCRLIKDDRFNPIKLEGCNWGEALATRNDIILGYQYFLGRPPESEDAINQRIDGNVTRQQFFSSVIRSSEFQDKYQLMIAESRRSYFKDECPYKQDLDIFAELWG